MINAIETHTKSMQDFVIPLDFLKDFVIALEPEIKGYDRSSI